jgi:hypothetical protein
VTVADDDRYETLFNEAIRHLQTQDDEFNLLCARASYLLAASTIATSFLGASALSQNHLSALTWGAIAAFAISLALCTWLVASPVRRWGVGFDPKLAYERYLLEVRPMLTRNELFVEIVYQSEQTYAGNEKRLQSRRLALLLGAMAMAVEIILWLIDLGMTKAVTK